MHDTQVQRIEAFGDALFVQDWGHITKQNYVNKSFEGFVNIYNELYGIHCPLKKLCIRNKGENRPRFIKGLANACKKRIICTKKYIKCKTMHAENKL